MNIQYPGTRGSPRRSQTKLSWRSNVGGASENAEKKTSFLWMAGERDGVGYSHPGAEGWRM